jgi:hypothetical protein
MVKKVELTESIYLKLNKFHHAAAKRFEGKTNTT